MTGSAEDRRAPVRSWRDTLLRPFRLIAQRFTESAEHREIVALLQQVIAEQQRQEKKWRAMFKDQLSVQQRDLLTLVQQVATRQQQELKWRAIFRDQLNALIRKQAVAGTDLAQPYWLAAQRFRLRSQNEEDGVTLALLNAAGITNRRFVEIGSGSSGGNSAVLAFELGWSGLMVEASERKAASLQRKIAFNSGVTVAQSYVTPETFNELLSGHGITGELDFMSIDIDSTDYWLLDALHACSPRVLIVEYNALFGPSRAVTLPAAGLPEHMPKGYFGASLSALEKKAREKGYRLVHCDTVGVNAFFLRNDVAPQIAGVAPSVAFRPLLERTDLEGAERTIDVFALIAANALPIQEV